MPGLPYRFRSGTVCTCPECAPYRTAPSPAGRCMCCDCENHREEHATPCNLEESGQFCQICTDLMEEMHAWQVVNNSMPRRLIPRCRYCGRPLTENCGCCQECGNTREHCECRVCQCGTRYRTSNGCRHCDRCRACCDCVVCESCDQRIMREAETNADPRCDRCRNCPTCCRCNPNEGKFWGTPNERYPYHLGVEVECGVSSYHSTFNLAKKKWGAVVVGDGSLRDLSTPLELCTSPACGTDFVTQITELCAGLKASKGIVNRSCGLHIHINCRDMTTAQIVNVIYGYTRIEPAFYMLVSRSRRNEHYSKALMQAFGVKKVRNIFDKGTATEKMDKIDEMIYGSREVARDVKRRRAKYCEARYHGLNINSLPLHGTLEFRHHQGTTNPTKILMWAAVVSAVVHYGATHTQEEIKSLGGSPIRVLEKMIGDKEVVAWTRLRRRYFIDEDRKVRGLPPIRRPQKVRAEGGVYQFPVLETERGEIAG